MPKLSAVVPRGIRAERARQGWTQAELASRMGWSATTVGALESGQRKITLDHLGPLCSALGVTLAELARGADEEERRAIGLL